MSDRHIRLTDEQAAKLNRLHAKLGLSENEIMRQLVEHADEVSLKTIGESKERENLILANLKQQNWLMSNLTKNVNQLAKFVNANHDNLTPEQIELVAKGFDFMTNEMKELKEKEKWHLLP